MQTSGCNPAAADDRVAVVEDRGLAGGGAVLEDLVELDAGAAGRGVDARGGGAVAVAHLHAGGEGRGGRRVRPAHIGDVEGTARELAARADDDAAAQRV